MRRRRDARALLAAGRSVLERRLGVDTRALAAFRVGLGVVLLVDLGLRARDLVTFYTDAGVLPRAALARLYPGFRTISLHALSGEAWVQAVLFLVAAAFAVALVLGYRTRIATVGSLLVLVSLHARNPLVLNAGDVLLRRLLLWAVFLPLGARWAVDARRDGSHEGTVAGVATAGLLAQVVLVYATNAAFKLRTDVWTGGDAIRYVFALDQFTAGVGPALAAHPGVLEATALGWLGLVCCSWLLLVLTGRARTLLAAAFAAGHLGMLATMDLGVFPLVSLVGLVPFVAPGTWDWVGKHVHPVTPTFDRWLPRRPVPPVSVPFERSGRRIRATVLTVLLVGLLLWNAIAVDVVDRPEPVPAVVEDRAWDMFANPPRAESWVVANATVGSERTVSHRVPAAGVDRPPDGDYPRARWRKYQLKVGAYDERPYAHLARDVCRRWSATVGEPVQTVNLTRVVERTRLDGPDQSRVTDIGSYDCSTGGPVS